MDAGDTFVAGAVPGERIATDIVTADSSTFTTAETQIGSVTAALVAGRTYRVKAHTALSSSVAGDEGRLRIREDNATGTQMQDDIQTLRSGTVGGRTSLEAEYTAGSTGNKTFVLTAVRQSGSGNVQLRAASNRPSYLYVDYIRG